MNKKCIQCGICREVCPIFQSTKNDTFSPRGKSILKSKGKIDKSVFYKCTVCEACDKICPVEYKQGCERVREKMVKRKMETRANKEMIKNIRRCGNPFGRLKKSEKPKKLYCC